MGDWSPAADILPSLDILYPPTAGALARVGSRVGDFPRDVVDALVGESCFCFWSSGTYTPPIGALIRVGSLVGE